MQQTGGSQRPVCSVTSTSGDGQTETMALQKNTGAPETETKSDACAADQKVSLERHKHRRLAHIRAKKQSEAAISKSITALGSLWGYTLLKTTSVLSSLRPAQPVQPGSSRLTLMFILPEGSHLYGPPGEQLVRTGGTNLLSGTPPAMYQIMYQELKHFILIYWTSTQSL